MHVHVAVIIKHYESRRLYTFGYLHTSTIFEHTLSHINETSVLRIL